MLIGVAIVCHADFNLFSDDSFSESEKKIPRYNYSTAFLFIGCLQKFDCSFVIDNFPNHIGNFGLSILQNLWL